VTNAVGLVAVAAVSAVSSTPPHGRARAGRVVDQRAAVVAHRGHHCPPVHCPSRPRTLARPRPRTPRRGRSAQRRRRGRVRSATPAARSPPTPPTTS
jgi:hypothetical protein